VDSNHWPLPRQGSVTVFWGFPQFTNILQIAVFLDRRSSRVFRRLTRVAARLLRKGASGPRTLLNVINPLRFYDVVVVPLRLTIITAELLVAACAIFPARTLFRADGALGRIECDDVNAVRSLTPFHVARYRHEPHHL
jgi:hypothetical protein